MHTRVTKWTHPVGIVIKHTSLMKVIVFRLSTTAQLDGLIILMTYYPPYEQYLFGHVYSYVQHMCLTCVVC